MLLHGAAFNSLTWSELNPRRRRIDTIPKMAVAGHHVIAVDLPRFGESSGRQETSNGDFLANLIAALPLKSKPIVVSPSMSGSYSLPALVKYKSESFCGFVPVAPVATSSYRSQFSDVNVPTLIIVGELDGRGSSKALRNIPTSSDIIVIPKGGHPAYLNAPELWHQLLHNFIVGLEGC